MDYKENDILNKIPKLDDDDQSDKFSELEKEIQHIAKDQGQIIKTINRKSTMMMGIVATIIIVVVVMIVVDIQDTSISHAGVLETGLSSGYVIENLKGEKINTFVSWKIEPDDPFHIHVIDSPSITQEQLDMINDIVYSTDGVV